MSEQRVRAIAESGDTDLQDAIDTLQAQVVALDLRVDTLETNYIALEARVTALETP